jgi:TRAP-type C4-dicarboxylate transport system substrate-binding protein
LRTIRRSILALALLLSSAAGAEPITLKLSFFTSDSTVAYQTAIKPFVDAINRDGGNLIRIELYPSGTLGRVQKELPQLLRDGAADIAFVIPGQNPELFTDNAVIELPGLFRNVREATLTYTRLVQKGALAGYQDFFAIGVYATEPEIINSRKPLGTLADLKGQTIRTNNSTQAKALNKLGAMSRVLAFNETSAALASGALDGATVPPAQLFDVGIGRLTNHHYLLGTSVAPLTLLMNRNVFDRLPDPAKALIRQYSGEWTASRFVDAYERANKRTLDEIKADPRRTVVVPSAADQQTAKRAFHSIVDQWAGASRHNRDLLTATEAELDKIRSAP